MARGSASLRTPQWNQWNKRFAWRAANNLFVFPAIALAAHLGQTKIITDEMLMVAAEVRSCACAGMLCAAAACFQHTGC